MTDLLIRAKAFLFCVLFCGGTAAWAQDGPAPDPMANCPPANNTHCIVVDYPAGGVNNCPMEVCLEYLPTPYLQSLCPVAWNGNLQYPCVTLLPGQTGTLCFNVPAGDVNTWYTYKLKAKAVGSPWAALWNILIGQPFYGPHQPGAGCGGNAVFVQSTDGNVYVLRNDFIVGG